MANSFSRRKLVLWGGSVFVGFSLLIIVGLIVLNYKFSPERVKPLLEKGFGDFLHRKITIEKVSWDFFPMPNLVGLNVRLWDDDDTLMLHAPQVNISIGVADLLKGLIEIQKIRIVNPDGVIRQRSDGTFPIQDIVQLIRADVKKRAAQPAKKFKLAFQRFEIVNGSIDIPPLRIRLTADAAGDIQGEKGARLFPFWVRAHWDNNDTPGTLHMTGSLGRVFELSVESDIRPRKETYLPTVHLEAQISKTKDSSLDVQLKGEHSHIIGSFLIPYQDRHHLRATIKSPHAKIEEVLTWRKSFKSIKKSTDATKLKFEAFKPYDVTADVRAQEISYKNEKFEKVQFNWVYSSTGSSALKKIQAHGFGGILTADAKLESNAYRVQWDIENVDMFRLSDTFNTRLRMAGSGSTHGFAEGRLDQMGWMGSKGEISLSVRDGNLFQAPVILTTLSKLNLKSLFRKIDGRNKMGFPFKIAELKLYLDNGLITVNEPGVLESKTTQVAMTGKADLNINQVDGRLVINFLSVTGEIIGAVPGLKSIVLGGKKSFFPLFVRVKGDIRNPDIKVETGKSITEPVVATFGRVLSIPSGVVKFLKGNGK